MRRMKAIEIIREVIANTERFDEITVEAAVRSVHAAAEDREQQKDVRVEMVNVLNEFDEFAAATPDALRQLALENTDLVEPEVEP